jgi:uncharacterized cofD-like protein
VRVTGIGGGHGLAVTLAAARAYASDVAAVVTVADDGGSSGRLTRELGIPPPGDIRNCLAALATDAELAELVQHRFGSGALAGHALGNLLIAALAESTGDFAEAVGKAARLVRANGSVHPATTELVGLRARVNGGEVEGQVAVAQAEGPIQAVYLEPAGPRANDHAVEAILSADQIVIGPGSLFTSVIATLLVPGIAKALAKTRGHRVFVCNARVQERETSGFDAAAHVAALLAHAGPRCVDTVIVQRPELGDGGVAVDTGALSFFGVEVVRADVATSDGTHTAGKLAAVLERLA